ncbi:MAG: ribonuclease PH [Oligoflexia bacterium]|nr:ribonuclease PH [Oligoflexia bacterium]
MTRQDKRATTHLRNIKISPNFTLYAEGSVLVEFGNTKVICTASVEPQVPQFLKGTGKGWVTAEYSMLPRSTHTRVKREKAAASGRTQEIQRLIGRSLRAVTDLGALGEKQVIIDCDVIQADGGTRTASITGGFVALAYALKKMLDARMLIAFPLKDYVAAISCGIIGDTACVDLNYEEDSRAEVDMNFVMTGSGHFVEIQGTAESKPFSDAQMAQMTDLAKQAHLELFKIQESVIGSFFKKP